MSLPNRVTLELTSRCNRRCIDCPRLKTNYPLGDMSWSLFNKIINQVPSETIMVPFFRGESLIYPRFTEAMGVLQRFDTVQFATNGDYLTHDNRNAMLKTCSFISFSLHSFGYPLNFKEMTDFLVVAKEIGILTQVSILESFLINSDKQLFINKWLQYVDRVRIYVIHSRKGFGDVESHYKTIEKERPCYKPLNELCVYWDGKVALCCYDWNNIDPPGDLNIQTIEEVWCGDKYQQIRDFHKTGRLKQVNSCKDCDYWMLDYLPNKMFGELYENTSSQICEGE